uniref:Uncharacterized protein n=1 Tax=Cacopsylla melanoneura TaxID=428564 RepID=A0A8D8Q7K0_9HEMI
MSLNKLIDNVFLIDEYQIVLVLVIQTRTECTKLYVTNRHNILAFVWFNFDIQDIKVSCSFIPYPRDEELIKANTLEVIFSIPSVFELVIHLFLQILTLFLLENSHRVFS